MHAVHFVYNVLYVQYKTDIFLSAMEGLCKPCPLKLLWWSEVEMLYDAIYTVSSYKRRYKIFLTYNVIRAIELVVNTLTFL